MPTSEMANCRIVPLATMCLGLLASLGQSHHFVSYPGTRGNTLITNSSFPFGMQAAYPCGGLAPTTNRTAWPLSGGGAIAIQPGWFAQNEETLFYINIGLGASPERYVLQMAPRFRVTGPSRNPFPGTFCLPALGLPPDVSPKAGDLASIQVVQAHSWGMNSYTCSDIVFTDDRSQVPEVDETNCYNSSDIRVEHVRLVGDAEQRQGSPGTSSTSGPPAQRETAAPSPAPATGAGNALTPRFSGVLGLFAAII